MLPLQQFMSEIVITAMKEPPCKLISKCVFLESTKKLTITMNSLLFFSISHSFRVSHTLHLIKVVFSSVVLWVGPLSGSFEGTKTLPLRDQAPQRWPDRSFQDHEWSGWHEARTPLQDISQCTNQAGTTVSSSPRSHWTKVWTLENTSSHRGWWMHGMTFQTVWWMSKQPTSSRIELMSIGRIMET